MRVNENPGFLDSTYVGPVRSPSASRAANRGAIGGAGPELKRRAASPPRRVKLNDPQLKLGVFTRVLTVSAVVGFRETRSRGFDLGPRVNDPTTAFLDFYR